MIGPIVPRLEARKLRDMRLPVERRADGATEFADRRSERLYARGRVIREDTADLVRRSRRAIGRSQVLLIRSRVRISRS